MPSSFLNKHLSQGLLFFIVTALQQNREDAFPFKGILAVNFSAGHIRQRVFPQ